MVEARRLEEGRFRRPGPHFEDFRHFNKVVSFLMINAGISHQQNVFVIVILR